MSQVKDIIDGISHRLPDKTNLYPALNRAVRMIAKRLFYHDCSLIRGDLSVTITADTSTGTLPSDYWGLVGRPYISGETRYLEPLPEQRYKLLYTSNSIPIYYEIYGTTIDLTPGCSSASTVKGYYFKMPTKLTGPMDTVPYQEVFDDAISEALIHTYMTGNSTGSEISAMQDFINKAVDDVAPYMDKATPVRVRDNLGLDYLTQAWGN
jgi:hypothetical protein